MTGYILTIDQGTTNSRAIIFNVEGIPLSHHEIMLNQSYPYDGWVEQDPEEMYHSTVKCCQAILNKMKLSANQIAAIGISNQRETTIVWDRKTGKPIYPAIVWQDRRTAKYCQDHQNLNPTIQQKTGLILDPYFSATKIKWILDNVAHARHKAEQGDLAFGTVDCYLLWKLTKGKSHITDATNASRTLLFNIHTQTWDQDLLSMFTIPSALLPDVLDCSADFGSTAKDLFGGCIPITGIAGDQQAATIGQTCFTEGMVKSTYGTGAFMVLNTGSKVITSHNKLLSTVAYRLANKTTYALEGSIFCAGATIKWLRENLKIIETSAQSEDLAKSVESTDGVYFIPAFTGLGAPYWNPDARAMITGMTRNTTNAHIVRAALEAAAYQSLDLLLAMKSDSKTDLMTLRVDGGMVENNWFLQFLSDMLGLQVQRPHCIETSALGAAYLAGLQVGIYQSLDEISALWKVDKTFVPSAQKNVCNALYMGWKKQLNNILS